MIGQLLSLNKDEPKNEPEKTGLKGTFEPPTLFQQNSSTLSRFNSA
ncbi:MAG TPA: hypothetical protein VEL70_00180 [Candidatus Acidoferrum sp.]|nr:hypothetical protein [Candidatus Acidoferrum sp.]